MGWEWRCFVPLPSALELSEATADAEGEAVEDRTDHYLLVASAAVGIKQRGGGGLEVKTLKQLKRRGAEKWKKANADPASTQAIPQLDFRGMPLSDRDGSYPQPDGGNPQAAALEQADLHFAALAADGEPVESENAAAHRASGSHWVSVAKQRQRCWGPEGVSFEQTTVALQLHSPEAAGGAPIGEPLQYRSFAMEEGPPKQLYAAAERWLEVPDGLEDESWLRSVRERLGAGGVVGGYPMLLSTAYQHVLRPDLAAPVAAVVAADSLALEPAPAAPLSEAATDLDL